MILLDGAIGTELAARGVATPPPRWSAQAVTNAPEVLAAIHRDYAAAGATMHTAATFRTTKRAAGEGWERLAAEAVSIARASVTAGQRIAGSVAPLADCYRPDLAPDSATARAEHAALARVLAAAQVDVLLCETFPLGREAVVAVEACVATGRETWVALTAGPAADLMTPEAMEEAARACVSAGAQRVLVNCVPATKTRAYLERIARAGAPYGAYANAGDRTDALGWGAALPEAAERYAAIAATWIDAGATLIGGCCGTSPAHIAAIARRLPA